MIEILRATLTLYTSALGATVRSFTRAWIIPVALVLFLLAMQLAGFFARPLGMLGGFLLGAVNALLVGATLGLIELAVKGARPIGIHDIAEILGSYFWDVISVGFVLWIPLMILDQAVAANPYGPMLGAMVFFLLFVLLNPAPEVIYQVRPGSPLDVLRHSYEFILENWIEWFLPLALVVAPFGVAFFLQISGQLGRGAGLQFNVILMLPYELVMGWLEQLGLSGTVISILVLLLTPIVTTIMMLFRGHLFAALNGSTRRKRQYQTRFS